MLFMKPIYSMSAFILLSINIVHANQENVDLCDPGQEIYINTTVTDGTSINFCMPKNSDHQVKKLQIRLGTPNKITFKHPEDYGNVIWINDPNDIDNYEKPLSVERYKDNEFLLMTFPFAGGGGMFISFKHKDQIYHYYSALIKLDIQTHLEIEYLDIYQVGKPEPISHIRTTKDSNLIQ